MYKLLFKLVLVRFKPETAHRLAFWVIRLLGSLPMGSIVRHFTKPDESLKVRTMGLEFPSPFGLAAGPDKNGKSVRGLGYLGFGHVEVGTLTAHPQPGNPEPRLFRLVDDQALINRMGFNNDGSAAAAKRLEKAVRWRKRPVIGANVGKSRVVDIASAADDYLTSFRALKDVADYFVINVSSPNTPGLRDLQSREHLVPLIREIRTVISRPLLLKIAPDLTDREIVEIAEIAMAESLDGIIATNTTISREHLRSSAATVRDAGAGGLSGAPLARRSMEVLRLVRAHVPAEFCVISVGGVLNAEHVRERLDAGATLVQGYTGFLYNGPLWARGINRALARTAEDRVARRLKSEAATA